MTYNHDYPLEEFKPQLDIIRKKGFKPIGVTQMICEDTFIFETTEEAKKAYETFEQKGDKWIGKVVGWWYGKEDFKLAEKDYLEKMDNGEDFKLRIYWL